MVGHEERFLPGATILSEGGVSGVDKDHLF